MGLCCLVRDGMVQCVSCLEMGQVIEIWVMYRCGGEEGIVNPFFFRSFYFLELHEHFNNTKY